jgi:diacylglycerol O-acyltransferase
MPSEPLSSIDTAWLRMEHPTTPMHITMAMIFAAPIEFERLRSTLQDRLLCFPRFRQRVIQARQSSAALYWHDVPDLDLDAHLRRITLPPPGDEATLRDLVSELISRQLDLARPLWQFHLLEGYGEGCVLIGRVHHCLADGPTLMHVLSTLVDTGLSAPPLPASAPTSFELANRITETLAQVGVEAVHNPLRLLSLMRLGTDTVAALSKVMFRSPDPDTVFRGPLGTARRVAWSEPLALADVKAIGATVEGTVNDVMLASVTGALRGYMQRRGDPVGGIAIRAGLSVDLHPPEAEPRFGNQAGAVLVSLPLGIADPVQRLSTVKRHMDALKNSPESSVILGLLNALGAASPPVLDVLVKTYCTRDTSVISNVPGPTATVRLAGAPLETLLFWVPALGRVGLSLNVVSYASYLRLAVATDEGLVPDPEQIVAGFHTEYGELLHLAHQEQPEHSVERMSRRLDAAIKSLNEISENRRVSKG